MKSITDDELRRLAENYAKTSRSRDAFDMAVGFCAGTVLRLLDRVAEFERLLTPFAGFAIRNDKSPSSSGIPDCCPMGLNFDKKPGTQPTLGDCRAAAKAMQGK